MVDFPTAEADTELVYLNRRTLAECEDLPRGVGVEVSAED